MSRFKPIISSFFAFLLAAGLMITTFHLHELANLHEKHVDHLVIEDIHLCPICEAVFEYHFDADIDAQTLHLSTDEAVLFQEQLLVRRIFTDKDGRSPPVLV